MAKKKTCTDCMDLDALADAIIDSYGRDDSIGRVGEVFLPNRDKIVRVLDLLRELLFPGYFGREKLTRANVKFHVGNLLIQIGELLSEQIRQCLCANRGCGPCADPTKCMDEADQTTQTFLQRLPELRKKLALDAKAAFDGDPAAKGLEEIIYSYPGYFAVVVYRIAHELLALGVPLMPRIMAEHAHAETGCDIHPGATIGESFFIDHATGVVIGETTVIGDRVRIYQGVTLGGLKPMKGQSIAGTKRHPTLEDDVVVLAGATILGGETIIGQGCLVGGNTFVMQSVEPGRTVFSKPPELQVKAHKKKPQDKAKGSAT